jgi:AraC-like DNA-binding protein
MVMLLRVTLAVLATVMFIGFSVHGWRQRSFGVACLALWMATLAFSAWAMIILIRPDGLLTQLGLLVAGPLSMLAGPLVLGYVIYAVRGERLHWAWFVPFLLYVAAIATLGTGVNLWFSPLRVMLVEFCYAGIAWIIWLRGARSATGQLAVLGVLAAITSLHLGQAAGIADYLGWIDFRPIRQLPLIIVSIWLAAALVMALIDAQWLRRLAPGWTPPTGPADRELFERSDHVMNEQRPWINPQFDIGALARLLDTYPNAVSRALNRVGNTTFYDYVNGYRVREARRLLTDPRERNLKIEALGHLAGFRARSTFFKLFRQHTGQSPSEYRAGPAAAVPPVQSGPPAH